MSTTVSATPRSNVNPSEENATDTQVTPPVNPLSTDTSSQNRSSVKEGSIRELKIGRGQLVVERFQDTSLVTTCRTTQPLKLFYPSRRMDGIRVFTSTFGGGLVAGDETHLDVRLARGATCVLTTQASTKVYKCSPDLRCRQTLTADVEDDALLVLTPDPVTCFATANYEQSQLIRVAAGGSLMLVDWLTAGRIARGECWAFRRYASQQEIYWDNVLQVAENTVLDMQQDRIEERWRTGRFTCFGTVVFLGAYFDAHFDQLEKLARQHGSPQGSLWITAFRKHQRCLTFRFGCERTDTMERFLRREVEPVVGSSGIPIWHGKV